MSVNRRVAGALLALLLLSTGVEALAAPITGTLDLLVFDPAMNGADLAVSTVITGSDTETFLATLDFTAVPNGTTFGPFMLDTNSLGSFSLSSAAHGSFAASSGLITTQTPNLLIVELLGIFTGLPGFDPTNTRVDVTITRSGAEGDALDASVRLTALGAAQVPEPALWTMLAIGGLGLARRRLSNPR